MINNEIEISFDNFSAFSLQYRDLSQRQALFTELSTFFTLDDIRLATELGDQNLAIIMWLSRQLYKRKKKTKKKYKDKLIKSLSVSSPNFSHSFSDNNNQSPPLDTSQNGSVTRNNTRYQGPNDVPQQQQTSRKRKAQMLPRENSSQECTEEKDPPHTQTTTIST